MATVFLNEPGQAVDVPAKSRDHLFMTRNQADVCSVYHPPRLSDHCISWSVTPKAEHTTAMRAVLERPWHPTILTIAEWLCSSNRRTEF